MSAKFSTHTDPNCQSDITLCSGMEWLQSHWHRPDKFVRPNWDAIEDHIENKYSESERGSIWSDCVSGWLDATAKTFGEDFHFFESKNFVLLTALPDEEADDLLEFLEQALKKIEKILHEVAPNEDPNRHIVFLTNTEAQYYDYVGYFMPDGSSGASVGMFLDENPDHFVFYHDGAWDLRATAVHELAHALLDELPLPSWVNEGVTQHIEFSFVGDPYKGMSQDALQEHRDFWNEITIAEFFSGKSFYRPDIGQRLSYHLAYFLITVLARETKIFREFVQKAHYDDGGEAALKDCYGRSLDELVAPVM